MTTMTGRRVPAPPADLRDLMGAAHNNPTELRRLHSIYLAWLNDNGHLHTGGHR